MSMKKKVWITKSSPNSASIFIWYKRPVWELNSKWPDNKEMGHWTNADGSGLRRSDCVSHNVFGGLLKVKFSKKAGQGYIAERIISVNIPGKRKK